MNKKTYKIMKVIILFNIILYISLQLTEDINMTPKMYSSSYSQLSHSLKFQAPDEDVPLISETAFTLWFRYNFYENQDINNLSHKSQTSSKYSHIAGIYNNYNPQCTESRFHTVLYKLNFGTEFTLCNGGNSYTCSTNGSNLTNFQDLDSNWAFLYQSYSHSLRQVITYVRIPSIDKTFFLIQTGVNNVIPMNSLHFIVGNCDPHYKFFGNFYNPRLYYKGIVHLGSQELIDNFYNTVIQPTLYRAKTDNFYYIFIGEEQTMSAFISQPLVEFSHYNEYAFYGWFKANQSIPEVWYQLFRLTNWHLPSLTDFNKCGDRDHAIFIRNGYYHHTTSNCRLDSNSGDDLNFAINSNFSVSEINSWNWLYVGYQHTTNKYHFIIYHSSTGRTQTYSANQGKFRMNNPKFHVVDTTFYQPLFNGLFKHWYIKLGPNSYKESDYTDMQNQTGCPSGTQLFTGSPNFCTKCDVQCQTCSSQPDQCDICKYTTNRSPPLCECDEGYVGTLTDSICQECQSPCKTCKILVNNCQDCIDGYYLQDYSCIKCSYPCKNCTSENDCLTCQTLPQRNSTTDCGCQDTYYDNNTECVKCVYPCLNCTSNTICLSCMTTSNRKSLTNCECQDGYYDDNTQCKLCIYPCSTCSSVNVCLSCKTLDNRISLTDCGCQDGFYDNGISCTQCVYPCLYCESEIVCKSCKSPGNRNNNTECTCNDTYYDNDTECIKCSYPCLNCTSDILCLSCSTTDNRKSITDCNCQDTYYDNDTECIKCTYPCINCTSADTCTSCVTDSNRSNTPPCNCNSGYFDNGTICEKCHYKCKECQGSSDQCIDSCSDSTRDFNNNCECLEGKFDQGVELCGECSYKCQTCITNAENCTLCKNGIGRSLQKAECLCSDTFYDDSQGNIDCIKCEHPCVNCTSQSQCISCVQRDNIDNSTCLCLDGYYENSNKECIKCSPQCQTCSGQADNCDTCIIGNNRIAKPSCLCDNGYFENDDQICEICQYPCQNCTSQNICLDCKTSEFRNPVSNQHPSCSCQDNYFDNQSQCQKCDIQCATCQEESHKCIQCSESTREGEFCNCKDSYYDVGNQACEKCSYKCGKCKDISTNCIECSEINRDQSNNCDCKLGFYEDQLLKTCLPCQYPCLHCQNEQTCTKCKSIDTELPESRKTIPSCLCQNGFYENPQTKKCEKCHSRCKQCFDSSENCTQCYTSMDREGLDQGCICKKQYYYPVIDINNNNEICKQCASNCKECDINGCKLCINPKAVPPNCDQILQENRDFLSFSVTIEGQNIQKTKVCDIQCSSCQESTSNCLKCSIGQNRLYNLPICSCKQGFYSQQNTADCLNCPKYCKSCTSYNLCTECEQNINLVLNKITGICECSKGFKEVHGVCVQCFNYQGLCLQQCPVNTIQDLTLKQCLDLNFVPHSKLNTLLISFGIVLVFLIISQLGFIKLINNKLKNFKFSKLQKLNQDDGISSQNISKVQQKENENIIKLTIDNINNNN